MAPLSPMLLGSRLYGISHFQARIRREVRVLLKREKSKIQGQFKKKNPGASLKSGNPKWEWEEESGGEANGPH